jgi:hypothetical protein
VPTSPVDIIDIYDEYVANPQKAKEKYHQKSVKIWGIVHSTQMTGFGAVVYLRHIRGGKGAHYYQDRINVVFPIPTLLPPEKRYDMGFDFQFDGPGLVKLPWRDGGRIVVTGKLLLQARSHEPNVLTISFDEAKVE